METITYDAAGQLKTYSKVTSSGGPTAFTFNYDTAGNREQEIIAPTTTNFTFNNVNQMLTSQVGSGSTTNYTYDNNGNLTNDGARSYEWDIANRLKAIVEGTKRFEFTYDGLGRRVKMVYKANGTAVFERNFIWCGAQPCREVSKVPGVPGTTTVKRYFAQGVLEGSDKYFYMRDHLGSVREVMKNTSSTVEARYDYDPWGRQTQTTGTRVFDIGYAGYMVFAPTGTNIKLNLTWYRAYSPELGRWLSRDPIGEEGGGNLYEYVGNAPTLYVDPFGLIVEGVFNRATGILVFRDIQKGTSVTIPGVFSGDGECKNNPDCESVRDKGPIPAGNYLVGKTRWTDPSKLNWYSIYAESTSVPGGWTSGMDTKSGRGNFFLHEGTFTIGCITVPKGNPKYKDLMNLLDGTTPLVIDDSKGNPVEYSGRLTVY